MSELVLPTNRVLGWVFETRRRFHAASAASMRPALRPMRGSGLGLAVESVPVGAGLAAPPLADEPPPQAARAARPTVKDRVNTDLMTNSSWGFLTVTNA